tara:strand:+ start:247 stop:456 length:210 start_codon:yes stop_codon:yes gene_type:complete
MSEEKTSKIWTDCGYFESHEGALNKVKELDTQFEIYKIRKVREKSKEDWYKVKAWKKPAEKKTKKKKKK